MLELFMLKKIYQKIICLTLISFLSIHINAEEKNLDIPPVLQKTPVWCWLATGEMVFTYYDIPNVNPAGIYQCGIIGALVGSQNPCFYDCRICTVPAGNAQNMLNMLRNYPSIAWMLTRQGTPKFYVENKKSPLSKNMVKGEIDAGRPIIAAISPSGFRQVNPEHVAVIVGYSKRGSKMSLKVNDPFPFHLLPFSGYSFSNPYENAGGTSYDDGSHLIDYDTFCNRLVWQETFYHFSKEGGEDIDSENGGDDYAPKKRQIQVPCKHRIACTHRIPCQHQVPCSHPAHPFDVMHQFDVDMFGRTIPCMHRMACRHPLHAYDTLHPFDLQHPYDLQHEYDIEEE